MSGAQKLSSSQSQHRKQPTNFRITWLGAEELGQQRIGASKIVPLDGPSRLLQRGVVCNRQEAAGRLEKALVRLEHVPGRRF